MGGDLRTLVGVTGAGEYAHLLAPLLDDADPDPDDDEVSGGFRLHRAVGGYLAGVARRAPVLLTLEDLHWADDQTLALLRALPSLLATSRVLLVVTCRESELDDRQSDVLAALARLGPVRVGLSGLDPKAVGELVRATCVREIDEDAVESIVERTGATRSSCARPYACSTPRGGRPGQRGRSAVAGAHPGCATCCGGASPGCPPERSRSCCRRR